MLRNYYINKEFIVSATARKIYRLAATASLTLFFMLFVLKMAGRVPDGYLPVVRLIVLMGVAGAALVMVGMEYFLFVFDKSSVFKKVFWFCVITMILLLGAPLYCFLVYSRSEAVNTELLKQVENISA